MTKKIIKGLSAKQQKELLSVLKNRFEENTQRHKGIAWNKVEKKLASHLDKLWSLSEMEVTGGEPDVVGYDKKKLEFIFYDCSAETPKGRRSVCYDREGLESRKEHRPKNTAVDMAVDMGIELLTEEQYRALQLLGNFDTKTSSWLHTPVAIRKLGVPSLEIFVTAKHSCITTVCNLTMQLEVFAECLGFEYIVVIGRREGWAWAKSDVAISQVCY